MLFSIVIPVYNRPEELEELLQSLALQQGKVSFEVIVVDDGSTITSEHTVNQFKNKLKIKYCFKSNTGPGDSRNYGIRRSSGSYFILLDSDCLLPQDYLLKVSKALEANYSDAFGGPDSAHPSFTLLQKAINYAMTSWLSTGGLRSAESQNKKFQLRSFNMGISSHAFELTGGFAKQRIGEDIDLNFRLQKLGCSTKFLPEALVYHKRRTTLGQFFRQTRNFGAARPILSDMHPGTDKFSYALPTLFTLGLIGANAFALFDFQAMLLPFALYFLAVLIDSSRMNKSLVVGILSCVAVLVQFLGYGTGYLRSFLLIKVFRQSPRDAFPQMFA